MVIFHIFSFRNVQDYYFTKNGISTWYYSSNLTSTFSPFIRLKHYCSRGAYKIYLPKITRDGQENKGKNKYYCMWHTFSTSPKHICSIINLLRKVIYVKSKYNLRKWYLPFFVSDPTVGPILPNYQISSKLFPRNRSSGAHKISLFKVIHQSFKTSTPTGPGRAGI